MKRREFFKLLGLGGLGGLFAAELLGKELVPPMMEVVLDPVSCAYAVKYVTHSARPGHVIMQVVTSPSPRAIESYVWAAKHMLSSGEIYSPYTEEEHERKWGEAVREYEKHYPAFREKLSNMRKS